MAVAARSDCISCFEGNHGTVPAAWLCFGTSQAELPAPASLLVGMPGTYIQWHGAGLPAICVPKQQHQEGLEKYSKSGEKEGRERKSQLSTAPQLRLQSQGWQCCSSCLHDLDKLQEGRGKPPVAAVCANRDRGSQAGDRGVGAIWDVPPQQQSTPDGPGCFYLCLSPRKATHNPHLLQTAFCGSWVCSHGSSCVGRGEHLMSLLWDPARGSRSGSRLCLCSPEGRAASPVLPGRRHYQHKGRPPRSQRVYLESSE